MYFFLPFKGIFVFSITWVTLERNLTNKEQNTKKSKIYKNIERQKNPKIYKVEKKSLKYQQSIRNPKNIKNFKAQM